MNEYTECPVGQTEEKSALKAVVTLIAVLAFLAGVAVALVYAFKKLSDVMSKVNRDENYPPLDGEDLTSTDSLNAEEEDQSVEEELPQEEQPAETPAGA